MEKEKKKSWLMLSLAVIIMICFIAYGVLKGKEFEAKKNQTTDKYLTANYALLMYENLDDYVSKNIDLDSLKENETVKIKSDKLINDENTEYKYCNGTISITKIKYGIFDHKVVANCNNESDDNVGLTMKIYTNINQNNKYQLINNFTESEHGYSGILYQYKFDTNNNSWSLASDGVSGIIGFDKDLNVSNINIFDEPKSGINTKMIQLSDGYILSSYKNVNKDPVLSYYDKNLKLKWEKDNDVISYTNYLYEKKDSIIVSNFGDIYSINKTDGTTKKLFTITIDGVSNPSIRYNDGILYSFNSNDSYLINKYDLNGKLISSIDISDYYKKGESLIDPQCTASSNITLLENKETVYVFNEKGTLVNTIVQEKSSYKFANFVANKNSYEITYSNNVVENTQKEYRKYNLDNKLIQLEEIDESYGYKSLHDAGLNVSYINEKSVIINGKLFEFVYSPDNNGTELIFMYDYSNSNVNEKEKTDTNNEKETTDNNETKEEPKEETTDNKPEKTVLYGDSNEDGVVNNKDITHIQKYILGEIKLTEQGIAQSDVNMDGEINKIDMQIILRFNKKSPGYNALPVIYKYGDSNEDGEVNNKDITHIQKYLSNETSLTERGKAQSDVNLDGEINKIDMQIILRHNKGSVGYTTLPTLYNYGDSNEDGEINNKDITHIQKYISGEIALTGEAKAQSDVNLDGEINKIDMQIILRHNKGTVGYSTLPVVYTYGDSNNDGEVNNKDITHIQKYISGEITLTGETKAQSDVNLDGEINNIDAQIILRHNKGTAGYSTLPVVYTYGDSNEDGEVNNKDITHIQKYISGEITLTDQAKAQSDVNLDGAIDSTDTDIILKYNKKHSGYEILPKIN